MPPLMQQPLHWRQPIFAALPAAELDQAAFSGSEEEQQLRLGAYEGAWDAINDRLQVKMCWRLHATRCSPSGRTPAAAAGNLSMPCPAGPAAAAAGPCVPACPRSGCRQAGPGQQQRRRARGECRTRRSPGPHPSRPGPLRSAVHCQLRRPRHNVPGAAVLPAQQGEETPKRWQVAHQWLHRSYANRLPVAAPARHAWTPPPPGRATTPRC